MSLEGNHVTDLIKFKDEARLNVEFHNPRLHWVLKYVLLGLAEYLREVHDVQLVVTCLYRTPEENKADGGLPQSAHLDWRAADIRTWSFTPEIEEATLKHLTGTWGVEMLCAKIHGKNRHLHINVNYTWLQNQVM
jgi:hypothetical protein